MKYPIVDRPVDVLLKKYNFEDPYCGADCPEGWLGILEELFKKIQGKCKIAQTKEKFGGLVVYVDPICVDDDLTEVNAHINEAARASYKTCQVCGNPGERYSDGWLMVLCETHKQERIEERKKRHGRR